MSVNGSTARIAGVNSTIGSVVAAEPGKELRVARCDP